MFEQDIRELIDEYGRLSRDIANSGFKKGIGTCTGMSITSYLIRFLTALNTTMHTGNIKNIFTFG